MDISDFGEKFKYSGNSGMLDIVKALEWVHKNIEAFGELFSGMQFSLVHFKTCHLQIYVSPHHRAPGMNSLPDNAIV